jgi:hypothetical protein
MFMRSRRLVGAFGIEEGALALILEDNRLPDHRATTLAETQLPNEITLSVIKNSCVWLNDLSNRRLSLTTSVNHRKPVFTQFLSRFHVVPRISRGCFAGPFRIACIIAHPAE